MMDELGLDLEKAKKIEDYANTILGFCSDESNNTLDVALILALASAKMIKVFGEYVDMDDTVNSKIEKETLKKEFESKYLFFINKFLDILILKNQN